MVKTGNTKIQWFYCLFFDTNWLCQPQGSITIIHWENTYINPYATSSYPPPPDGNGLKCICSRRSAYCIDAQSHPPSKGAKEMALVWLWTSPSSKLILPAGEGAFKSKLSEHSTGTHHQHTCHWEHSNLNLHSDRPHTVGVSAGCKLPFLILVPLFFSQ